MKKLKHEQWATHLLLYSALPIPTEQLSVKTAQKEEPLKTQRQRTYEQSTQNQINPPDRRNSNNRSFGQR